MNQENVKDIYNLTPLQEGILFHVILSPESSIYINQFIFSINGYINKEILKKSCILLIERHQVLRSLILYRRLKKPRFIILNYQKIDFNFLDLSLKSDKGKNAFIKQYINDDRKKGFDLSQGNLIRFSLIKRGENDYQLLIIFHHIILDGWSIGLILKDLFLFYNQLLNNFSDQAISAPPSPYYNYMKFLENVDKNVSLSFWKKYLKDYKRENNNLFFYYSNEKKHYNHRIYCSNINKDLTKKLNVISKQYGVTINTILQVAWGIFLQRINDTNDIVFGSVISGRSINVTGIESFVGNFIKTIPIRIKSRKGQKINELLMNVQNEFKECERYSNISLPEIQKCLNIEYEIFDHIYAFENYPIDKSLLNNLANSLRFNIESVETIEQTNYDFNLIIVPGEEIIINFNFNENRFSMENIQQISSHINIILQSITENPETEIENIRILRDKDIIFINKIFNDTEISFDQNKSVIEMFEDIVKKFPERIALVDENYEITFTELNLSVNKLCNYLIKKGVGKGDIISVMLERSIDMIISILGILKIGAVYMPIDPEFPLDRKLYILNNSKCNCIILNNNNHKLTKFKGKIINITQPDIVSENDNYSLTKTKPSDIMYILYTSGSTGKPKGVIIENRSVLNLLYNLERLYPLKNYDSFLFKTNFTFDVSVTELFGWIFGRGRLVLLKPGYEKDPLEILETIYNYNITHINFVPSMLQAFLSCIHDKNKFKLDNLKYIFVAGEAFTKTLASRLKELNIKAKIENLYGPTESTVYASKYSLSDWNGKEIIPIGKPIQNLKLFIVDSLKRMLPINFPGELCISGIGLARGYLNRDDLNQERFVVSPFKDNEKMYHTGDYARWLSNGNIEYLGRIDRQVKIRGYRIELTGIEKVIMDYKGVKQAIVIIKESNDIKNLYSYIVSDEDISIIKLKNFLKKYLPSHMIPLFIIQIENIPHAASGKVDWNALPDAIKKDQNDNNVNNKIENKTQNKLANIWENILGIELTSIDDDFFDLGGDSLKLISVSSQIMKIFNIEIPISELFDNSTIRKLSILITSKNVKNFIDLKSVGKRDSYPVSSQQKSLYYLQNVDKQSTTYNIIGIFTIEGNLEFNNLEGAIKKVIDRHESLRTSFKYENDQVVQIIHEEIEFKIIYEKSNNKNINDHAINFLHSFDLTKPPLLRIKLIELDHNYYLFLIDVHHIIFDGPSLNIFIFDLLTAYKGMSLKPLKLQYKDFAVWQRDQINKEKFKKQLKFWENIYKTDVPMLDIPMDYSRPDKPIFRGESLSTQINNNFENNLKEICKKYDVTLYMLLFAAYKVLLFKYCGQSDIIVGTDIATRFHSDFDETIGMFVNTLAIRSRIDKNIKFVDYLIELKNIILNSFENRDYPFDELVNKILKNRNFNQNPFFNTMFTIDKFPVDEFRVNDLKVTPSNFYNKISHFDLMVIVIERKKDLIIKMEYSTELFKKESIELLLEYYKNIIVAIAKSYHNTLDIRIAEIKLM